MSVLIIPDGLHNPEKRAEFVCLIQKKIRQSITHWERYSDGRIASDQQKFHKERYESLTDEVEEMLGAVGIKTDWPGLFPSLTMPDGTSEHDIERAIQTIFQSK